ncbi:MAG TPA: phage tail sheath C-terminal domain-containing protein [Vicinamibacterales bacterium]|nr:phage tail sheath C-terminal domain-containing protein [Vicinamibacterales bacterium]
MPEFVAPGTYVEEGSFRSKSIEGVGTSIAAFVGATHAGPAERGLEQLTSMTDFERHYGGGADLIDADGTRTPNFVWHAARAFFANGGRRLYVARTSREDGLPPEITDFRAALEQLEHVPEPAIVTAPGATFRYDQDRQQAPEAKIRALLGHAARLKNRFAVIDCGDQQSTAAVTAMRASFDSAFGALYYPWVRVVDPNSGRDLHIPPSGFVSGIYARVDQNRGVWKPPANEVLVMATGLEREISFSEHTPLNAAHVNCLRRIPGRGVLVLGARTLSSDPDWKYVNVRRLLMFLESSLDRGLQWAVFEPNRDTLWAQVRRVVEDFLLSQWRAGALVGSRPEEAFLVRCDRTTMTQNDLDSGRLVCLVGVAPVRPAEFVIFRIGLWTADKKP